MPRVAAHILDGLRPGMAQRLADGLRVLTNLTAGDASSRTANAGRAPLSEPGTLSRAASRFPIPGAVEAVAPPAGRRLCESPATNSGADA